MIVARRFTPDDASQWNRFVQQSRNGTFLFERGYMDYHADRFIDHSLMFEDEDGAVVALLPASRSGVSLVTHGGLTYGGFVTDMRMGAARMLEVFDALFSHCRDEKIDMLRYKAMPRIYHRQPAEEDLYALFRAGALRVRVDASATIALHAPLAWSKGRKHSLGKARKSGLDVFESEDVVQFHNILQARLDQRYDARPTHSAEELTLLRSRFPGQIRLFGSFRDNRMLAGVITYDCGQTIHAQYMASSEEGRDTGALDLIVHELTTSIFSDRTWFDFGISTEDQGRKLNEGLARQKEMFGARTTVYETYEVDTTVSSIAKAGSSDLAPSN
ncbi:hypothetical protein ABID21_001996 [Pseudorhizobium tarimense]|uniref:BioF2-like acetyltransferase domain-containing protein n=1 Tax=Pseudorhizobium tarimense TaxID=1079109 RepID=A0ABV2H5Q4_9HYPH|nr:GNAT family N-acetyltransferase [Pseudorhizobium tarimense]MCJ8519277.1 GNAT family N-acetyltransferase [Pseudorhizobium tarimense]